MKFSSLQPPLFFFAFTLLTISCQKKISYGKPDVDVNAIQQNYMDWYTYYYNNIELGTNFLAVNTSSEKTDKTTFLKHLQTGKYIPVKLKANDSISHYQLFKITGKDSAQISATIKSVSKSNYQEYQLVGKQIPDFSFTDLQGNTYTNKNLKDKTIVFKTWFIKCRGCIAEFPKVNALAKKFENNPNVVFISLATDPQSELEDFLATKPLNYKVIPDQQKYISNILKLYGYPTHLVVDKTGKIVEITSNADHLIAFLEKGNFKNTSAHHPAPPPPPVDPATIKTTK